MEIEILRENLAFGLGVVSRVLVSKPQLPILTHILLSASNGQLMLTASNLETTISLSVGAKVDVSGDFTVPGRTLMEVVGNLSAEKLTLKVKENSLAIESKGSNLKINGTPAGEYPKVFGELADKETLSWEIDKNKFVTGINKTIFSAATDESRAVLTGVLVKLSAKEATFAAADGFRLSVVKLPVLESHNTSETESFIIPAKTMAEVSRIVSEDKKSGSEGKTIKLSFIKEAGQVNFVVGEITILSRLISGKFPDFEKIIPPTSQFSLLVSSDELSKGTKLASIFARDSANIIKLRIANSKLTISANAPEVGENETEVSATLDGNVPKEDFTIAFNYHYLSDLMGSLGSTDISIGLNGPLSSAVFRIPDDPDFLHIISPVRVATN